jgi:cell pole-organizing protein PopZ
MSDNTVQEQSIDDILKNIRTSIKNKTIGHKPATVKHAEYDYDLLELTNIVQDDGSIYKVKIDDNITANQRNQLSNKIISDNVINEKLLSEEVIGESSKYISDFVDQLLRAKLFNEQGSADQLRRLTVEVVKPYMQDWLNKNLPLIVREILSKEIKNLITKIKSN